MVTLFLAAAALTAPSRPAVDLRVATVSATILRAHSFGGQEADPNGTPLRTIKRQAADGSITVIVE